MLRPGVTHRSCLCTDTENNGSAVQSSRHGTRKESGCKQQQHSASFRPDSGRSVAWLARLFRVQEVVSSNLTAPTIFLSQVSARPECFQVVPLPGCHPEQNRPVAPQVFSAKLPT